MSTVELFLEEHSLKDSALTPSQPKKKKLVKDVSDMTEEEQLQAAMLASMGADSSAATAMEQLDDEETPSTSVPEGNLRSSCELRTGTFLQQDVFTVLTRLKNTHRTRTCRRRGSGGGEGRRGAGFSLRQDTACAT